MELLKQVASTQAGLQRLLDKVNASTKRAALNSSACEIQTLLTALESDLETDQLGHHPAKEAPETSDIAASEAKA